MSEEIALPIIVVDDRYEPWEVVGFERQRDAEQWLGEEPHVFDALGRPLRRVGREILTLDPRPAAKDLRSLLLTYLSADAPEAEGVSEISLRDLIGRARHRSGR